MLKNFILVYYKRNTLSEYEANVAKKFPDLPKDFRLTIHSKLLELCIGRIRELYPKAEVHIISNETSNIEGVTNHVFKDLPIDHKAKFHIYGLLSEEAMYLDSDVLLVKPFSKDSLEVLGDINPYQLNHRKFFTWNAKKYDYYSASVVYIKNPSIMLEEEMKAIHAKEFLNTTGSVGVTGGIHPLTSTNDEFAMSLYISQNNLKIKTVSDVNVGRMRISENDIYSLQSIHYSSPKHLFEKDLYAIRKKERSFKLM